MKLETFVNRLNSYDLQRDNVKIVKDLLQLADNRSLLSEHLYNCIQKDGFSTKSSLYGAYAFVLYYNDLFTLRLGFWSPVSFKDEQQAFIYNLNHTHDFEMYCVGYSGDGYTTVMRTIQDQAPLQAGKRPTLSEERTLKLKPGEVLHMLPFKDIHRQLPPEHMSASLSLLLHPPQPVKTLEAWCFDEHYVPTYPGIAMQEIELFESLRPALQNRQTLLPS